MWNLLILRSVESSEVDLSDFQDAEDGTNAPSDNDAGQQAEADAAAQQQGAGGFPNVKTYDGFILYYFVSNHFVIYIKTVENEQAVDNGKKKLVITEEHFQRVTQALVVRLRQHEESVTKDGTSLSITFSCSFILTHQPCPCMFSNSVQL